MTDNRKSITQPADWWAVWQAEADKESLPLSAWMGKRINSTLGKLAQKQLSERKPANRPKKERK